MVSEKIRELRQECSATILADILNVPSYTTLFSHTYCKLMHIGLLSKAKEENLLDKNEWSKQENRAEVIKRIEQFLTKHIK